MATLFFKYLNPLWWAYAITLKIPVSIVWFIFTLPYKTVRGIWNAFKWGWNKFDNIWARLGFTALAVFTAIPGTWTWVFYEIAHAIGYGEEADMVVDTAVAVGSAMWTAGKFAWNLAVS